MIKLSHLGFALLALLALFAVEMATADESKPVPAATANVAGGWGEVITADAKADALGTSLAALSEDNASIDGVFSGRVGKVCQKQGCWLQLLDGEQMARVMTNHEFTVPKDLSGNAVVSGKLERVEISEKEARHMAKDSGKPFDPAASRIEYRISARGVASTK
ncbi:MAG: DUF4920 domain-containing protein [Rhodanobacteraceae bacterium]|nr:DUF4920 domain-containing protein [Rhodanobacteraceae bacterium]